MSINIVIVFAKTSLNAFDYIKSRIENYMNILPETENIVKLLPLNLSSNISIKITQLITFQLLVDIRHNNAINPIMLLFNTFVELGLYNLKVLVSYA